MGLSAVGQGASFSPEPTFLSPSLPALPPPWVNLQRQNTRRKWTSLDKL